MKKKRVKKNGQILTGKAAERERNKIIKETQDLFRSREQAERAADLWIRVSNEVEEEMADLNLPLIGKIEFPS